MERINIVFSSEEVNRRTIIEKGVVKFHSKQKGFIEQKEPYNELLREKLASAAINKTRFTIGDSFKPSGKFNRIVYVKCGHKKQMPVKYIIAEHQMDQPLTLTWSTQCAACFQVQITPCAEILQSFASTSSNYKQPQLENLQAQTSDSQFSMTFQQIEDSISKIVKNVKIECLNNVNPLQTLVNRAAQFGIALNATVIENSMKLQVPTIANHIIIDENQFYEDDLQINNSIDHAENIVRTVAVTVEELDNGQQELQRQLREKSTEQLQKTLLENEAIRLMEMSQKDGMSEIALPFMSPESEMICNLFSPFNESLIPKVFTPAIIAKKCPNIKPLSPIRIRQSRKLSLEIQQKEQTSPKKSCLSKRAETSRASQSNLLKEN